MVEKVILGGLEIPIESIEPVDSDAPISEHLRSRYSRILGMQPEVNKIEKRAKLHVSTCGGVSDEVIFTIEDPGVKDIEDLSNPGRSCARVYFQQEGMRSSSLFTDEMTNEEMLRAVLEKGMILKVGVPFDIEIRRVDEITQYTGTMDRSGHASVEVVNADALKV
jgi:hypothetical protein